MATSPDSQSPSRQRARRGRPEPFQRADGRWALAVEVPTPGKRQRRWVYGSSSKEVRDKADALRKLLDSGERPPDESTSLERYLRVWHDARRPDRPGKSLAPKTWIEYDRQITTTIVPYLGRRAIGKLTKGDIQTWIREMTADGKGQRTIEFAHAVLRKSLSDARRMNLVPTNVAEDPDIATPKRNLPKPWTEEHCRTFIAGIKDDKDLALFLVLAICGLRPSEALSLTWPEIDLERGTLRTLHALTEWEGVRYIAEDGKSEAARRTLSIPPILVAALRQHKAAQDALRAERAEKKKRWRDNDLVFANNDGGARRRDSLYHSFVDKIEALGLPHIRLYDLRRLAATLVLSATKDLHATRAYLGHSSITLTSDTYGYLLPTVSGVATASVAGMVMPKELEDSLAVSLAVTDHTDSVE